MIIVKILKAKKKNLAILLVIEADVSPPHVVMNTGLQTRQARLVVTFVVHTISQSLIRPNAVMYSDSAHKGQ
jgi:hypothetical protein